MAKKSFEPFMWLLFGAGGMLVAFLVPILLLLFGVLIPFRWVAPPDYLHILAVLRHPLTRAVLLGSCVLALFHAAHRFYFVLHAGLLLKQRSQAINRACYGGAIIGSIVAGCILLQV